MHPPSPPLRAVTRIGGLLVLGACAGYVGSTLRGYLTDPRFAAARGSADVLWDAGGCLLLYSVLLVLPSFGWWHLLRGAGARAATFRETVWVFSRTGVAKYLPGNVFHYLGRGMYAPRFRWTQPSVAASSLAEIALLVSAGATIALTYPLSGEVARVTGLPGWITLTGLLALAVGPWGALALAGRVRLAVRHLGDLPPALRSIPAGARATAWLAYAAFLAGSGVLLWVLLGAVSSRWSPAALGITVAAYGLTYVLSHVAFGLPGGVGVREAMIVFLLGRHFGPEESAAAAVLLRIVAVLGDVVYLAATATMGPGGGRPAPPSRQAPSSGP